MGGPNFWEMWPDVFVTPLCRKLMWVVVVVSDNKRNNGLLFIAVINKMVRGSFARDATDLTGSRKQFLFGLFVSERILSHCIWWVHDNDKILRVLGGSFFCVKHPEQQYRSGSQVTSPSFPSAALLSHN